MNQGFRFNNPKQCSNWIILVLFCSSHLTIKNCYDVHFMKIEKIYAKIDFFAKNSKKFVYYNEELVHKFKRNYLENYNDSEHAVKTKNAPFFMIFPNISFFHMVVNYWIGPLIQFQTVVQHNRINCCYNSLNTGFSTTFYAELK